MNSTEKWLKTYSNLKKKLEETQKLPDGYVSDPNCLYFLDTPIATIDSNGHLKVGNRGSEFKMASEHFPALMIWLQGVM